MLKLHLLTVPLLAGALSLQPAIGAEKDQSAGGDKAGQSDAAATSKPTARIGMGSGFSYECDDACLIPGAPVPAGKYAVVSPIGKQAVEMITQTPRLNTLDGKTIAVVGGSFMANVTHPEIKRLILENYPTAKVILLGEIGSGGPFPGPGVRREANDEFQKKLKEMGVQAVISGNGGCGLCTPKETGSSIAAEYMGIPAVTIAGPTFVMQVYSTSVNNGVPAPRAATYPGAFAAHSREELLKNTKEVVWPQIVKTLTEPINDAEIAERRKATVGDPKDRVFAGTVDGVNSFFTDQRWSDGLPIIPPTVERVEEFLKYTDLPWDETVGVLPIAYRKTLVWHVAVNGVMAGCPPEFMPLLIAYTKALANGNYRRTLASTHAWTPFCWVNGPVSRQLGIDSQQGYDLNENALTAASALMWGNNLTPASHSPEKIMQVMAWDVVEKGQFATGSGPKLTPRTIMVTEYVARDLAQGYKAKEDLENALVATARRPAHARAYSNYWANPGSAFDPTRYTVEMHTK